MPASGAPERPGRAGRPERSGRPGRDDPEAGPTRVLITFPAGMLLLAGTVRRQVGWAAVGAALVLGGLGVWLVTQTDNDGGPVAIVCMLAVAAALLVVRSAPLVAAALVLAGVIGGQLFTGPLVTCGIVLPVVAVLGYRLASRPPRRGTTVAAAVLLAGVLGVELLFDPVFGFGTGEFDASGPIFVGAFEAGFVFAGLFSRDRRRTLDRLRLKTQELVRQRELTAAAAIAADRARLGLDLDATVRDELRQLVQAADRGQITPLDDPAAVRAAFAEVEAHGRAVLAGMRAVVGNLDHAGTEPPPGLAQLDGLVRRATAAEVRLRIDGAVRPIGPHLELSVFRVVEYLLGAADSRPGDRVEVRVRFGDDSVGIRVSDRDRHDGWAGRPLDAARARAEAAGGRLELLDPGQPHGVSVSLPIPVALTAAV